MEKSTEEYEIAFNGLREHPFFKNIDEIRLNTLLQVMTLQSWKKGQEFYSINNTLRKFHIILKGRVKVYQIDLPPPENSPYTF